MPLFVDQNMGSRELHDALEERIGCRDTEIRQVLVEGNRISFAWDAGLQDGFDLRAKDQPLTIPIVIQRLFTKAVAGSQKTLAFSIPNGEGEHTAQMRDTVIPVLLISMNDRLCVTISAKRMPPLLKFSPQLAVVIDFAVKDNQDALIFVKNRLVAASQVYNRETAHTQSNPVTYPDSLIVWSTVAHNLAHPIYELLCVVTAALYIDESSYSAH